MSKKSIVPLPSFGSVAVGTTALIDLPTTGVYHAVYLRYTEAGTDAAQVDLEAAINQVRVKINSKVQREFTAAQLNVMNAARGVGFEAGLIPIYFYEPWRKPIQSQEANSWGMADVESFTIEVDIDAAATTPGLTAFALKTFDNRNMGAIVKVQRRTVPVTTTGAVQALDLRRDVSYYALHFASTNITNLKVILDNREEVNVPVAVWNGILDQHGYVRNASYTHLPFDLDASLISLLSLVNPEGKQVKEFRLEFEMGSATPFTMLAEMLGLRD